MGQEADESLCGDPSQKPAGDLRQLLESLAMREPSEEELNRLRAALSEPRLELGGDEIEDLVQGWTKALRRSLRLDVPCVRVICGFSSVLDTVYRLDAEGKEARMFIEWAASQLGMPPDDLVNRALLVAEGKESPQDPQKKIQDLVTEEKALDLIDMVALLFWCMRNKGRKPLMQSPALQKQMEDYIEWRQAREPGPDMTPSLGGAAGNMCYILRALGLRVSGHWMYHPEPMTVPSPYCLTRVVIAGSGGDQFKQEKSAGQKEIYFDGYNRMHEHPVRRNTSFEFPEGMPILGSDGKPVITATIQDRVIYRTLIHRSPDRGWDRIVLRVPALGGGKTDLILDHQKQSELLGPDGWPFVPLFSSLIFERDRLVIDVADDQVMEQIAGQTDYFIFTALQGLGDPLMSIPLRAGASGAGRGPKVGDVVKDHLIRQLRVLSDNGVVIHTEIPAPAPGLFEVMSEVIFHGRVRSVGIGDDDLLKVTGSDDFKGTRFFYADLSPDERDAERKHLATARRWERAEHLAKQTDVDELYAHGTDVDLVARRRTSRGALWREMESLLLAKAAVVLALMKRAGVPGPISPEWTAKGFRGLVEFARGFAQRRYPGDAARRECLFKEILNCRYFFEKDSEAYSAIATPVLWPEPSPDIVTVGAGDMTSSVVAIFSGK